MTLHDLYVTRVIKTRKLANIQSMRPSRYSPAAASSSSKSHPHHHHHHHQDWIMFKGPWRAIDAIPCKPPQGDTGSLQKTGPAFFLINIYVLKKYLCFMALDPLSFARRKSLIPGIPPWFWESMGLCAADIARWESPHWGDLLIKPLWPPFAYHDATCPNFIVNGKIIRVAVGGAPWGGPLKIIVDI